MRTILHIPDASLLITSGLDDMVSAFCTQTGVTHPDVICLPLWDGGGAQWDSPLAQRTNDLWDSYSLEKSVKRLRSRYKESEIYLSVMPDLPTVRLARMTTRSQYGNRKPGTCVVNPYVQDFLVNYINDARKALEPEGIVWDIVDIQGQNAEDNLIEITCFCEHCRQELKDIGDFDGATFAATALNQNPLNLVLQDSGSSISFVSLKARRMTSKDVVALSIVQGIFKEFMNDVAESWAEIILQYVDTRSAITGRAIGTMNERLKSAGAVKTGAIINFPHFDWTGGTDLSGLRGQVDEIWLDLDDLQEGEVPDDTELYQYMASRACYSIDAYFEIVSDHNFLLNITRERGLDALEALIEGREERMFATLNLRRHEVELAKGFPGLAGIVGVPVARKHTQLISQAAINYATAQAGVRAGHAENEGVITKEVFENYIASLFYYEEQGNELNRQVLINAAKQMGLL